jgi:hypothetical protein
LGTQTCGVAFSRQHEEQTKAVVMSDRPPAPDVLPGRIEYRAPSQDGKLAPNAYERIRERIQLAKGADPATQRPSSPNPRKAN